VLETDLGLDLKVADVIVYTTRPTVEISVRGFTLEEIAIKLKAGQFELARYGDVLGVDCTNQLKRTARDGLAQGGFYLVGISEVDKGHHVVGTVDLEDSERAELTVRLRKLVAS
jgi:hypothetical protein